MTDKKTETSQDDRARTQTPVLTTPANKRVPPQDATTADAGKQGSGARAVLAPLALVVALAALGLSGVLWQQMRQTQDSQTQLSAKLSGIENEAGGTAGELKNLLGRLEQQGARIGTLEDQLGEASAVIQELDEALRIMTDRGSELVLLNDIDHLVTIAQQQLQLGGNVRNAIVALESAQAQLARANRPAMAVLMQTLNGDLDRLRAASTIDIAAFSRQLEELAVLVTEAPLIMPDASTPESKTGSEAPQREQPAPTLPPSSNAEEDWWSKAWSTTRDWSNNAWDSLREDLGQFIEVRRVDDANALLMSPDQAERFRDNLRTRIMTAQLALMMRQPEVWKTETEAVVKAIESRFDESSPMTRKALRMARNMADATIDASLPTVENTLQTLAALREEQSRSFTGGAEPEPQAENDTGAQTAPELQSEPSAQPQPEAQPKPEAQPQADTKTEAETGPESEPEETAPDSAEPEGPDTQGPASEAPGTPDQATEQVEN